MKTYLTFTLDVAQARHILDLLETTPPERPGRRKGLVKMFGSAIRGAEMRAAVRGDAGGEG